jgi:hypothetical protein
MLAVPSNGLPRALRSIAAQNTFFSHQKSARSLDQPIRSLRDGNPLGKETARFLQRRNLCTTRPSITFSRVTACVSCGREAALVTLVRSTFCTKNTFMRALEVKGGASQTWVVDAMKTSNRRTLCTKGANGRRIRNDSTRSEIGAYTDMVRLSGS